MRPFTNSFSNCEHEGMTNTWKTVLPTSTTNKDPCMNQCHLVLPCYDFTAAAAAAAAAAAVATVATVAVVADAY